MRYYFAPLEGITDRVFRDVHHRFYPGIDRYYTPFLSPTIHRCLTQKEQRELPPAENLSYHSVPQILTKNAEDFLWLAKQCQELGYTEVNLNLGCPSGTVTAKGKGSGMLRTPDMLDAFLDAIFSGTDMPISVKTRIGFADPDEFPTILNIFNRYPICELIIHPRVRNDFYNGDVNINAFRYAIDNCNHPICYNGDITKQCQLKTTFKIDAVMIGRGLIANPGLLCSDFSVDTLKKYLNCLLETYMHVFGNARNAMFRLKEHWRYLQNNFKRSEKLFKQLRRTTDVDDFFACMNRILAECPFNPE